MISFANQSSPAIFKTSDFDTLGLGAGELPFEDLAIIIEEAGS
jgi:hypothetical protein